MLSEHEEFNHAASGDTHSAVLAGGQLKDGQHYTIELTGKEHLGDFLSVHEDVRGALAPDQKGFLLPKERELLERHLLRGGGNAIMAVRSGGRQIAQAIIVHPEKDHHDYSIMRPRYPVAAPEKITFMQAASVHPDVRGQGLLLRMIEAWMAHAARHGRTQALAEVKVKNMPSLSVFLRAGMHIDSITLDPVRNDDVYNFTGTVGMIAPGRITGRGVGIPVDIDDIEGQRLMLSSGYIGVGRQQDGKLLMRQRLFDGKLMFDNPCGIV